MMHLLSGYVQLAIMHRQALAYRRALEAYEEHQRLVEMSYTYEAGVPKRFKVGPWRFMVYAYPGTTLRRVVEL